MHFTADQINGRTDLQSHHTGIEIASHRSLTLWIRSFNRTTLEFLPAGAFRVGREIAQLHLAVVLVDKPPHWN